MNLTTIVNLVVAACTAFGVGNCFGEPENQQRKMERKTATTTTGGQDDPADVETYNPSMDSAKRIGLMPDPGQE